MRKTVLFLAVGLVMTPLLAPSHGQAQFLLGVQGSYSQGPSEDVRSEPGVGVRAAFPVGRARWGLELSASADLFMPDCGSGDCSYFGLNANAAYRHERPGRGVTPYVGSGIHYRHVEVEIGDEEILERGEGLNALVGAEFLPGRNARPFVEARYEWMMDLRNQYVVTVGVLF